MTGLSNAMDKALHENRAKIVRQYMRRIGNLVKLDRFGEAGDTAHYFATILRMFEIQNYKANEAALKDGSASQRKLVTK